MCIAGLMRRLSLTYIDVVRWLGLVCLLMRIIASFLRYTGYLNFIDDPISRVSVLTLIHVLLPSFPYFWLLVPCQEMCDALHYLLDNIFIRFGSKLHRQIVGIPMSTNSAPLVADLFLFCCERLSCCLCQTIIKLILLKILTPPPEKMTYLILIILIRHLANYFGK